MQDAGRINASEYDMVIQFVKNSQQVAPVPPIMQTQSLDWKRLSFEDRAKRCSNPVSAKLLETMAAKKSNLCVAIDVSKSSELVTLAESVGPFAFAVKTHVDILEDWTPGVVKCCHFSTFPISIKDICSVKAVKKGVVTVKLNFGDLFCNVDKKPSL